MRIKYVSHLCAFIVTPNSSAAQASRIEPIAKTFAVLKSNKVMKHKAGRHLHARSLCVPGAENSSVIQ